MPGYPLTSLLRIRNLRERSAAAEVAAARHRLDEAGRILQQCREDLRRYGQWRLQREEELFLAVKNQRVSMARVDEMKDEMVAMGREEARREEQVLTAEKVRDEAREALDKAREAHARAVREKSKILEHRNVWDAERLREEERAQDLELEEVPYKPAHHAVVSNT